MIVIEIKFRVWNGDFFEFGNFNFKTGCLGCNFSAYVEIDTPQQYTGLQDINGVDIYEGDIVRSTSELIKPFASLHDEKTGVMVTKHKLIQFNDEKAYFTSGCGLPLSRKVCETYYHVVGNIYENQSLIDENTERYRSLDDK